MGSALDKFVLKYEEIRGYTRAVKDKVGRKIKPQKHPFLKGHKLDKGWAEKLDKPVKKAKSKVNKPVKKVSRRRPQ